MKIYAEVLEEAALEQFKEAMAQPFVVDGALMPDAHKGYSLPIGAVVSTKDVIVPAWVGYDIGCGMCALKLPNIDARNLKLYSKEIFDKIYGVIPVGFNTNNMAMKYPIEGLTPKGKEIAIAKNYGKAIGSLGGGNHFIEIGADEEANVWVVIHSGSRGVGHGIAAHYMTLASSDPEMLAKEFDDKNAELLKFNPEGYAEYKAKYIARKTDKLRPKEGHYGFDVESQNGKDYIQDLKWTLDFALANRMEMMVRVVRVIEHILNTEAGEEWGALINRNHNHAVWRGGVWIHRKGATQAEIGMSGVIPGNMRDGSFIVEGKGNPDSLFSSSHGAGRVLGRREANRVLNLGDFKSDLEGVQALVTEDTLDESPLAYKNIFEVMAAQTDLVQIITRVRPLINIKG